MNKIKEFLLKYFNRYRGVVLYIFFGGITTLINIVSYYVFVKYIFADMGSLANSLSNAVAWLFSVLFAFFTNKVWVFESKSWQKSVVLKEIISFFSFRFATGILDMGIMILGVDILKYNELIMKVLSNVLVLVSNYVGSKLFIFKKK